MTMAIGKVTTLVIIFASVSSVLGVIRTQPEQVHLSYGADCSQMIVTWVTMDPTPKPTVEYGRNTMDKAAYGKSTEFTDGGPEKRKMYVHRVLVKNLTPGEKYVYHCGSELGWSSVFTFTAMKNGTDWSPTLAVYGDLGNKNGKSIPRLQEEVERGVYDAILHNGDFAYDMDSDNARIGDEFMRQIEPIASLVPYMTSVGNHEQAYNFSNYVNRFTMVDTRSGEVNNHFYSFNLGPAHIISFSTEFYFFVEYGWTQIMKQYEWLESDLREAAKPENREKRPWIITMGHRPMYCSTDDADDCAHKESIIRKGIPIIHLFGLEDLFYKYGVDLEIWAHEHAYERMWPLYDRKVYNGTKQPYTNPNAPVHMTVGSAGCQEGVDPFVKNPPEWSAVRISDYGYTRMRIFNKTHLYTEQISDDQGGAIVDSMMLIKEHHGVYKPRAQ